MVAGHGGEPLGAQQVGGADQLGAQRPAVGAVVVLRVLGLDGRGGGVVEHAELDQLGLYQYAVDHGAVTELAPGAVAGGAELVQLGLTDGGETAVVQAQDAHPEDGAAREDLRARLGHAASLLRSETFPAVAGQHCRDCTFVAVCPIKSAGSVTAQ